jgi:hypothetical protein
VRVIIVRVCLGYRGTVRDFNVCMEVQESCVVYHSV